MKIYLASDHAGFELKNSIAAMLREEGHDVEDCGNTQEDSEDDYPDFVFPAARAVAADPSSRGIVFGGSGQGEAMAANRIPGVRAAVYYGCGHGVDTPCPQPIEIVRLSREHNDANVLSLGARFLSPDEAREAVTLWLATPFSGEERHIRRLHKLDL